MHLRLVGCCHREVDVARREQLAFDAAAAGRVLEVFRRRSPGVEAVLLSTCNRVELYLAADERIALPSLDDLAGQLAAAREMAVVDVARILRERTGWDVVRHLLSVAAGMESIAVGEAHISGQVKDAYLRACRFGTVGPRMHRLFQTALRTAKRIAAETEFGAGRVSIPSLAIGEVARTVFDRLDDKRTLLVGAGGMARESLKYISGLGVREVTVVNRSRRRADELAATWSARSAEWSALWSELAAADMIVCATSSARPIMTRRTFERRIGSSRSRRPLLAIDLGVPRDIEPAVGKSCGVHLVAIDDLKTKCRQNLAARHGELPAAEAIVDTETQRFFADAHHRQSVSTIRCLLEQWHAVKEEELARLRRKLAHLDDRSRVEIERAFDRLLGKLLHRPLDALRDQSHDRSPDELLAAMRALFDLQPPERPDR